MRANLTLGLALGWIFLTVAVALSESGRGKIPEPPWADLERILAEKGINTDTTSLLEAIRSNTSIEVRWMAIEVLGLRREEKSTETLHQALLHDSEIIVRETAALALARLGDKSGVIALQDFMRTSLDAQQRMFLAARLAELGDPSGYPYVVKEVSSDNAHLRFLAVGNLIVFLPFQEGKKEKTVINPIELLQTLARDQDSKIREEVLLQFALAVFKGARPELFRPIVADMAEKDPKPEIRGKARLTLLSLHPPQKSK